MAQQERLGTGLQSQPLLSGGNDNPSLTQGTPTTFFFNNVPDRAPSGQLAYLLPFVDVTISGNFVQAGGGGSVVPWDSFVSALLDSGEISNAWHGTPISANNFKGAHAHIWEYICNGFRYASRRRAPFAAANGTYPFDWTFRMPLSARYGNLIRETSQLALLYQNAQLKLNIPPASVITGLSAGSSLTALTCRASAKLLPTTELTLGTVMELVMSQFASGGSQITIPKFGTDTYISGVLGQGGVAWLGWLTSVLNQGGSFTSNNITQFNFPWRGQVQTNHTIDLALDQHLAMINDRPNEGVSDTTVAGHQLDSNNFPYLMTANDTPIAGLDQRNMYAWPLVPANNALDLTDLQTAAGDQTFNATATGGFGGVAHIILGHYARVWQVAKAKDWVAQIMAGGANSLAAYVLGAAGAQAAAAKQLMVRTPKTQQTLTPDQGTYLAHMFTNA